ncbi:LacI family DNA-binding transcriptional regulator [Arthrobacter sp. efr-133-R2A-63]|uniref:LacI family DNA-binding transcriptional regulator n=1 Tax=Arthrobacter sp. efr-133-R2A-63 TaxID=3040278 RepID=UPI002550A1CA|nr:LacI family DNA-binding transcriptional regulator [Arthrobacter sp. efr-133-R2A-63]
MTTTMGRRTTAADVAREAGVSPATVGFVLNRTKGQTISEETRARVLTAAQHLNYKPHQAARALRSGRNKIVLLVLPDWPLEYSLRTNLEVLTHALAAHGYALITFTPRPDSAATPLWAILEPAVVIGYEPFSAEQVADMESLGIRNIIPSPGTSADQVSTDFASGPRLQTEYLLGLGHQRLGYAHPSDPRLKEFVKARLQLVNEVCIEAGGRTPIAREVDYQDASGSAAAAAWREAGVTAVIAYNDETAADVIAGAVRSGIRVPEDLSVVGHDNSPLAARYMPSITSIALDMERLALYMAGLAMHLAEGHPLPDPPTVAASLVCRESVIAR